MLPRGLWQLVLNFIDSKMLKQSLVIWMGPVAPFQVPGATVPGAKVTNVGCLGDRAPNCVYIADGLKDAEGRRMPGLLRRLKIDPASVSDIFIGAFSAGGALAKRLLLHPADRAMVKAVMLSDATYTGWDKEHRPVPAEGFVAYGVEVVQGAPRMLVATASTSPNKSYPNGVESMLAVRDEIARRTGQRYEQVAGQWAGIDPPPVAAWRLGNTMFADYQMKIGHAHPKIAGQVWQSFLLPWLAQPLPLPMPPSPVPLLERPKVEEPEVEVIDWGLVVGTLVAASITSYVIVRWLRNSQGQG